jgi:hypothetical protein
VTAKPSRCSSACSGQIYIGAIDKTGDLRHLERVDTAPAVRRLSNLL